MLVEYERSVRFHVRRGVSAIANAVRAALTGTGVFTVDLQSSNFCSSVVIVVPLSGTLVSYDSATMVADTQTDTFRVGTEIYLLATTIAQQTITNTHIISITINPNNIAPAVAPVLMWSATGATAAGTLAGILVSDSTPGNTFATSSFTIIGSYFGALPNQNTPASISMLLSVTFLDTSGLITHGFQTFDYSLAAASQSTGAVVPVIIDNGSSSAASTISSTWAILAAVVLNIIFCCF